ncbi:oxidoreductase [Kordiimonas aquimaris]|uniref:oxidoreductase n=1 Tax=Kordiimonas aquimaris TaxID=707591 RepID=UPI0021D31A88|nr:oxidoreductase [Kordiimonas aquimaris]
MAAEKQKALVSGFDTKSTASEVIAGMRLDGKTAVVTGGYSGLGLETVKALAGAGAKVIVPARRPDVAGAALSDIQGDISVGSMDLSDLASVRRFAEDFVATDAALDILINNAAIMACPETRVGAGWEAQFATNHLGHFLVTHFLMPAVLKANAPRVVSLSSIGHKRSGIQWDDIHFEQSAYDKWAAYGQAKTANSLFALGLQQQFSSEGLDAFAVHPGGILTPLQRHLTNDEMMELGWTQADGSVSEVAAKMFKSPEGGAATSVWCATSEALTGQGGVYCEDCDIAVLADEDTPRYIGVAPWAVDESGAEKLWDISKKMLDL